MINQFLFLNDIQNRLLREILARRRPLLAERINNETNVSREDAEEIMHVITEEFMSNLDDDWEPAADGCRVNSLLALFNAARIQEWP